MRFIIALGVGLAFFAASEATADRDSDRNHRGRTKKVKVVNFPATQEVTGAVEVTGSVEVTNQPAVQEVTGSVEVSNQPLVQQISGEVAVTNQPAVQDVFVTNPPSPVAVPPAPRFQLVGFTEATYQGDATLFGLTGACKVDFPASRMCSSVEILETSDPDAAVGLVDRVAWVRPVLAGDGRYDASTLRLDFPAQGMNCVLWTFAEEGRIGLTVDENGTFGLRDCIAPHSVACCALMSDAAFVVAPPIGGGP